MSNFLDVVSSYFGIAKNTAATVFITLLVFITGQFLSHLSLSIKSYRSRRSLRKVYRQVIEAAIKTAKKQEKISGETMDFLRFEKISRLKQKRVEFYQYETLKSVGFEKFHESYFQGIESIKPFSNNKLRIRSFTKCWETMTGMNFWVPEGYRKIDELCDLYNKHDELRKEALKQFRFFSENLMQLARKFNGKRIDKELGSFLTGYFDINTDFQKTQDLSPRNVQRKLIVPLRSLSRKHPSVKYIPELNNYLLEASLAYENMYHTLKKARLQYFIYSCNFRFYYRTLEKALKVL